MKKTLAAVALTAALAGCATPLTSTQKQDMRFYESKGYVTQEKNPATGAALGLLPGGGSFYVREYGAGIVNLLFWPASVLWDPISGYDGSMAINYHATKQDVNRRMNRELRALDDQLTLNTVTREEYVSKRRSIEAKYKPDA